MSIALTNACELNCPYCYAPKFPARLDRGVVISWAKELDRNGCLGLGFGGGEPTAHPDFAAICRAIACETQLAVSFTTHGHRVTRELVREIQRSVHFVRVSMDGVGATYERLRGRSFTEFCRHLSLVTEVAPFGINYVVNRHTIETLDEAVEFATAMGASEFLLLPEQATVRGTGIDTQTANRLAAWICTAPTSVRLAISKAGADTSMPLASPYREESPIDAHVHVDARGAVKKHAYADRGVPVVGSIVDAIQLLRVEEGEPL